MDRSLQSTLLPCSTALGLVLAVVLSACGATRPPLEVTRPWEIATEAVNHPPQLIDVIKPHLSGHVTTDADLPAALKEKVTLRSEAIDIRSLMLGLAKQTGLNITLDPDVTGQVSAYFTDVEVFTALQQIADQLGAEVQFHGNVISVHRPRNEERMFRLQYLRNSRAGYTSVGVLDRAGTSTGTAGGGATGSGPGGGGATTSAPVVAQNTVSMSLLNSTGTMSSPPSRSVSGDSSTTIISQFTSNFWEDLGKQLTALVFEGDSDKDINMNNDHSAGMQATDAAGRALIVDSMTGTIVVRARRPVLDDIGDYIKAVEVTVQRQVVIDVRILEVDLSEGTIFGIESNNTPFLPSNILTSLASTIFGKGGSAPTLYTSGYSTALGFAQQATNSTATSLIPAVNPSLSTTPVGFSVSGTYQAPNLSSSFVSTTGGATAATGSVSLPFELLVQMLGQLSDVRVVSSPRLTALHNQKAILKVVRDHVYFLLQPGASTITAAGPVYTTPPTYSPIIVPEGVVLDITPLIDDNGEVTLEIHPSFSTIADVQNAPSGGSEPEVDRREFETTVHVKGEETVMLGGLVTERSTRTQSGIPYLEDIPFLGGLFRTTTTGTAKTEIILLLTPRVQGPTVARDFVNGLRTMEDQDPIPVIAPPPVPVSAFQPATAPAPVPIVVPSAAPEAPKGP